MTGNSLGSFVITFERTDYILGTILSIQSQPLASPRILVVDNSVSFNVRNLVLNHFDRNVSYFPTGTNVGPAGAAKIGLLKLASEDFDWIYWGDDDDPPTDPKTFERLLEIASLHPLAGIIGKVGGRFNTFTGRTRVFSNKELSPVVEADYVTGGKHMIVSSKIVKAGILPDPKLFFGFEELEFCLRVKDAGFKVLVDGQGIMDARNRLGNLGSNYRWKGKSIGDISRINRQYYSLRNMLFILWSRKFYFGYFFYLGKSLIKIPFSIRYGSAYFLKFSNLQITAVFHHWKGRYGQYISTK